MYLKYKAGDIIISLIIFQICTLYIHYRFNNVMKHIYMRTPVGEWRIDL